MAESVVTEKLREVLGDLPEPTKDLVIDRMVRFMRAMPQNFDENVGMQVSGTITHGPVQPGARLCYDLNSLASYVAYGFK